MAAGPQQRVYELYYDEILLGELRESEHSSAGTTWTIDSSAREVQWPESVRRYAELSQVHHGHLLQDEPGRALALENALSESASDLGEHLWYLIDPHSGKTFRIWRPYFGCEQFIRFAYASPRLWREECLRAES